MASFKKTAVRVRSSVSLAMIAATVTCIIALLTTSCESFSPVGRRSVVAGRSLASGASGFVASIRTQSSLKNSDRSISDNKLPGEWSSEMRDASMWDEVAPRLIGAESGPEPKSAGRPTGSPPWSSVVALSAVPLLWAAPQSALAISGISAGQFDPQKFQPVCSASDGFYRFLQGTTQAVVGDDNFIEYGPLIAGGLLRVRLELCVVESFFNEAIGPFIKQNGLSWVLPLHETVETFLAGTIFSLATTFILVGSTKLISVIVTYGDVFIGVPCRLFGNFFFDRALGKPVTLDIGIGPWKTRIVGPPKEQDQSSDGNKPFDLSTTNPAALPIIVTSGAVKYVGEGSKLLRETIDALDVFVGRYLVFFATFYIGIKFIHFKIFPDFPPF